MTAGFTRIISLLAIVALTARVASSLRVRDQLSEPAGAPGKSLAVQPQAEGPAASANGPSLFFPTAEHDRLMASTGPGLWLVCEKEKRGLAIGREGAATRASGRSGEAYGPRCWYVPQSSDGSSHRPDDGTLNLAWWEGHNGMEIARPGSQSQCGDGSPPQEARAVAFSKSGHTSVEGLGRFARRFLPWGERPHPSLSLSGEAGGIAMKQVAGVVEANQWRHRPPPWWLRLLLLSVIGCLLWWSYSLLTRTIRARSRELERVNRQLSAEIAERQSAERRLREAHEHLERRVAERTAELMTTNAVLRCEIQERRKAEEALKERLALEDLIAAIATDFVRLRAEEIDAHINQALAALGAFAQVDRSYVFVFSLDGAKVSCTHEWVAEGIHPEIENLRDLLVDDFPWWMEQLRAQQNIYIPCVDALPPEAAAEKEILRAQSIQSLIVVPMISAGELLGFLGFDSVRCQREWPESFIPLLRISGEIIANAIARNRVEEKIRRTEEHFRAIVEGTQAFLMNVDVRGRITYANDAAVRALGFAHAEEVLGQRYLRFVHPEDRERVAKAYKEQVLTRQRSLFMEFRTVGKDGNVRWFSFMSNPMLDREQVVGQNGVGQDITARKVAEETLAASLREKEMLLKEIHHRVKNNMQVVCSLLNLQCDRLSSPEAVQALRDSQNRVKSMALIHEKLYRSASLSRIDFGEYLHSLVDGLMRSYATNGDVNVQVTAENAELGIDDAIPCGLMVNELISNALKHAFPDGREGVIRVSFRLQGDRYALEVADDGVGLPADLDFRATKSLGLQLVTTLVDQIDGHIELHRDGPGTHFSISFPAK